MESFINFQIWTMQPAGRKSGGPALAPLLLLKPIQGSPWGWTRELCSSGHIRQMFRCGAKAQLGQSVCHVDLEQTA